MADFYKNCYDIWTNYKPVRGEVKPKNGDFYIDPGMRQLGAPFKVECNFPKLTIMKTGEWKNSLLIVKQLVHIFQNLIWFFMLFDICIYIYIICLYVIVFYEVVECSA